MEGYAALQFSGTYKLTVLAEINLSDLQKSLDTTALELVDNQKDNMLGRKKLAEQTRGAVLTSFLSHAHAKFTVQNSGSCQTTQRSSTPSKSS